MYNKNMLVLAGYSEIYSIRSNDNKLLRHYYYLVHGAESAQTAFTFPEGQGSLSLEVLPESVKFYKNQTGKKTPIIY